MKGNGICRLDRKGSTMLKNMSRSASRAMKKEIAIEKAVNIGAKINFPIKKTKLLR